MAEEVLQDQYVRSGVENVPSMYQLAPACPGPKLLLVV